MESCPSRSENWLTLEGRLLSNVIILLVLVSFPCGELFTRPPELTWLAIEVTKTHTTRLIFNYLARELRVRLDNIECVFMK